MIRNRLSPLLHTIFLVLSMTFSLAAQSAEEGDLRKEETEDYYRKWLEQDVAYIITDDERAVFNDLTTPEEKEQFIEQFWYRRDPNPGTAENAFKEEHYRRLAYANEWFGSGIPGWVTDRGRIYIIHGPPADIESYPSGGTYERPLHEGGGSTTTFPFEIWRYRRIDGIGLDVELEFVDPSFSGEYHLALRPEEKDALLHIPGGGPTLAEQMGLASKRDRPYFSRENWDDYPMMTLRAKDNPFVRFETHMLVQAPQEISYKDLKQIVSVDIGYDDLPFKIRQDFFRLNESHVLTPITVQIPNKDLTFEKEGEANVARLAIYGLVTSITNRVVTEFEEAVNVSYRDELLQAGLAGHAIYQKVLSLDSTMRYKLELVVKDLNSEQIGVKRSAIMPPEYQEDQLSGSSLILSNYISQLQTVPDENEMFVLGDIKVRPNMENSFSQEDPLGIYLQLYNASIDAASMTPALRVDYRVLKNGEILREATDSSGESTQFFSGKRVVLVKQLNLNGLEPGHYQAEVHVVDRIADNELTVREDFDITATPELAAAQ